MNSTRLLRDDELEQIALHFRLLGERVRRKILQAICKEFPPGERNRRRRRRTQANVSKNLALLASAGLIKRQ